MAEKSLLPFRKVTESANAYRSIVDENEISVPDTVAFTPRGPSAAIEPEMVAESPVGEIVRPAEGFNVQLTGELPAPYGVAPTVNAKGTLDYCDYEVGTFKTTVGL